MRKFSGTLAGCAFASWCLFQAMGASGVERWGLGFIFTIVVVAIAVLVAHTNPQGTG